MNADSSLVSQETLAFRLNIDEALADLAVAWSPKIGWQSSEGKESMSEESDGLGQEV